MVKLHVLLCVFLLAFTVLAEEIDFDAVLEGAQQTPPITTLGQGSATFTLDVDSRKLHWDISYDYLDSGVTMAHIHGPAELGENGGVLVDLEPSVGKADGRIKGSRELTRDQADFVIHGLTYVNIHTNAEANGEIRGQILTTEKYFQAELSGSQEVPPVVDTAAEGEATISIDYEKREMKYKINHSVDDATAIHFHAPARRGANAAVILEVTDVDSSVSGTHKLSEEHVHCLRSGLIYVNVHSEDHPNGEIRGQVEIDLDGSSEGDNDWWIVGLILVVVFGAIVLVSAGGLFLYQKKGDAIRQALSSKSYEAHPNISGISNEPLLTENN